MAFNVDASGNGNFDGWVLADSYKMRSGGTPMAASYQDHQHIATVEWAGNSYMSPAEATRVIHVFQGAAGLLRGCVAGFRDKTSIGNSTVTIDIYKDGVSIVPVVGEVSQTLTLDTASVAYTPEAITIATASLTCAADEVIEAVITYSAGTGTLPTGLFVGLVWDEDYV